MSCNKACRMTLRSLFRNIKYTRISSVIVAQQKNDYRHDNGASAFGKSTVFPTAVLSSIIIGTVFNESKKDDGDKQNEDKVVEAGEKRPDLPTYRAEEVSKHDSTDSFWVIYRHGVYDVTSFLPAHPGGEQILNAAGLSIEPFWNIYGMHKTEEVYQLLESYRIGNLHDDDIADYSNDELWAREPVRSKQLLVKTAKPFNAETPPPLLVDNFDTPSELFYVRQHMPVPEIDEETHKLTVRIVNKDGSVTVNQFSLKELDEMPQVTVRAALMCAGNRRSEMEKVRPVKGLSWGAGAIGNATWRGVALRDLLLRCGLDPDDTEGKHVIFQGADIDATGTNFSTSLPLHAVLSPARHVVLARRMNGARLARDHGRPLRAVAPGAPAVRSVKWLESITVSTEESGSHWHQKDYRSFNASTTWDSAHFPSAPPVYSLPVTAAACVPRDGDVVPVRDGAVTVKGYAYSGGGASIVRVDVSSDGGRSWRSAALARDAAPPGEHYAWTLWQIDLPAGEGQEEMEIWVKATDSNFNTQPEKFDDIWNIRGILANAYHKIKIKLQH